MSDKTCVTCGKGVRYIVTCSDREHQHAGLHQPDDTCQDYVERTDSVEQVALDMLALIKAARMRPIVLDPNKMPGGQIFVPLPETEFADRMRALGIEVTND